jgi:hypothetical protein
LKDIGASPIQRKAYLWRILDVEHILEHATSFSEFLTHADGDCWIIDDALLRGLAVARHDVNGNEPVSTLRSP